MGVLLAMVLKLWLSGETDRVEVPLYAPADPAQPFPAARPEWQFLFLFQFLKYFPGGTEVLGAIVAPLILLAVVLTMPCGSSALSTRFSAIAFGVAPSSLVNSMSAAVSP